MRMDIIKVRISIIIIILVTIIGWMVKLWVYKERARTRSNMYANYFIKG